jgi:two-component system, NtrC family, sensor kinase
MDTMDFQADFTAIMDMLKTRLGITNAIIRRLEGDELKTAGYFGYEKSEAQLRIFVGQGVTGRCAKENITIVINDLERYDGQYLAGISGARSELCIPIRRLGKLIGTLNVESVDKNNFTRDKIDVATGITEMLAHSLHDPTDAVGRNLARALAMLERNSNTIVTES